MNYLAHFHLAWPDEVLLLGGLEGDFHKGVLGSDSGLPLGPGINLHRKIDAYTDHHSRLAALREHFSGAQRRYAGILIDLSFDHFLSLYWTNFHEQELSEFNLGVYQLLAKQQHRLSPAAASMALRITEYDLLGAYHSWDAVPATARRIGERFKRGNPFYNIEPELAALRPELETAFLDFYPDLLEFVTEVRSTLETRD